MPRRKHVAKALVYITQGDKLLVFKQPESPRAGVQIPGGSIEPGEALEAAALREAYEETGLSGLVVQSYLGSAEYELKVDVGPPHLRHFFHLAYAGTSPARWEHIERTPSLPVAPPRFELWWEPIASVRLDWEMDYYLELVKQRLERGA